MQLTSFGYRLAVSIVAVGLLPACKKKPAPPPAAVGYFEKATSQQLIGWAWDKSRPDEPVTVEVYNGSTKVMDAPAGLFRQDLVDAHIGNGKHGFIITPPPQFRDGNVHTIHLKVADSNKELIGSPKEVKPNQ